MFGTVNNDKIVRMICFISCLIFFVAHIAYLTLFSIVDVKLLVFFNIFSVSFYAIMFLVIKFRFYSLYVILTALEIALYMFFGTIVLGTGTGLHLCLIGLCTLIYFAGYFSSFGSNKIKPLCFCIVYAILFIIAYVWTRFNEPLNKVSESLEIGLYVAHSVIVFGFVIAFLAILTKYSIALERKILKESETDKLTNVFNRTGLFNYYNRIHGQEANYIVAIFDIDDFKHFNDINGHLCGDYVLYQVAKIANDNSPNDFVSRWGGEEFVIISKIEDDIESTFKKLDNIRENISKYNFIYNNKRLKTTITIGAALFDNDESLELWIKRADNKLYEGKHSGKNKTVY